MFKQQTRLIDDELAKAVSRHADKKNPLFGAIIYSLFPGGKRIRPLLCLHACSASGGKFKDSMPAALAIELIHGFSLVHDDLPCMDDDDFRRGKPSCHKKYGEANAVLAGDAMLSMAFSIIADIKDRDVMAETLALVSRASGVLGMTGGQAYDMKYAGSRKKEKLRDRINLLKTGELFIAAIEAGAIAAKAGRRQKTALRDFGKSFGAAFQLRDDILDKDDSRDVSGHKLDKLIAQAKKCLDIFGKKADNLKTLADKLQL